MWAFYEMSLVLAFAKLRETNSRVYLGLGFVRILLCHLCNLPIHLVKLSSLYSP
jgi:hypothetical protein